jgi:hypothetical protein
MTYRDARTAVWQRLANDPVVGPLLAQAPIAGRGLPYVAVGEARSRPAGTGADALTVTIHVFVDSADLGRAADLAQRVRSLLTGQIAGFAAFPRSVSEFLDEDGAARHIVLEVEVIYGEARPV